MSGILIVDDNRALAENLQEILEDEGFEAAIATDGLDAVAALERDGYDLVITDIRMPGLDGAGLLATINERWPSLPVIAMTAYSGDEVIDEMRAAGALDVLAKPLELESVLAMVERIAEAGAQILVVEDDPDLRINLSEALLEVADVVPHACGSLRAARKLAGSMDFPIAVIDVRLPDGDGFELAEELRARHGDDITIIYITGYAAEIRDAIETALSAPHMHLIEKPFSPAKLVELVRGAT